MLATGLTSVLGPQPARARPTGPLSPASGALFGAHVKPYSGDWSQSSVQAAITQRETDLGRKLNIDHHTYAWSTLFPSWKESWDISNGRTPMISWTGMSSSGVNSGQYDGLITTRADAVKSLGSKVFIRLAPSMDGSSMSGTPTAFISAWQRVVRIFRNRGATNAVWVWCPNAGGFATGQAQRFYPGDSSVDWICAEGYNWAPGAAGSSWTSFFNVFKSFYDWGKTKPKPLMIGGTGVQERWAGEKAAWFDAMSYSLKNSFPNVQALVYTDAKTTYDWRPNTSTGAYSSYKKIAADPYFNPAGSAVGTPSTAAALLGAYVQPHTGWMNDDFKNAVYDLENRMGRKLDIGHHFYGWKDSFPGFGIPFDVNNGRIPMISWDGPSSVNSINSGSEDWWIRQQANAIKAVGKPVMLRWLWEMDIRTNKSVSASAFTTAWRRIHGIFKAQGATNARWVWCPTSYGFATGGAQNWYPGDTYVDWLCSDGYNWGDATNGKWRSFSTIFGPWYSWAAPKTKPLMIGEIGSLEGTWGQKAQWISDMGTQLKSAYPEIKALVYFDSKATSYSGGIYDWRLDSTVPSFEAWRALGADPYFRTHSHNI